MLKTINNRTALLFYLYDLTVYNVGISSFKVKCYLKIYNFRHILSWQK